MTDYGRGPLDPAVADLLAAAAARSRPPIETLDPVAARSRLGDDLTLILAGAGAGADPGPAPVDESTVVVPGDPPVPVRLFCPPGAGPHPLVVWFHGGGFVLGDATASAGDCRSLARRAGAVVVSVGYRLAPEHRFPAALADGAAVVSWAADEAAALGGDPDRLAVGGDSAGGTLAAVTARRATRAGRRLVAQLLLYPATDLRLVQPSVARNADGPLLTARALAWFVQHYLGDHRASDPDASPLLAPDLTGLPPALVVTAGFDPLADDGVAYAAALRRAGVPVAHRHFPTLVHGFTALAGCSETARAATVAVWSAAAALLAGDGQPPAGGSGRRATVQPACDTDRGS